MEPSPKKRLQVFQEIENKFKELEAIPEEFTCRTNIVSEEPTRIIELRNVQLFLNKFGDLYQLDSQSLCQNSLVVCFYDLRDAMNAYSNIQFNKTLLGNTVQAVYLPSPIDLAYSDQVIMPNAIWTKFSTKFREFGELKNITKNHRDVTIRYWDIREAKVARQELNEIKQEMQQKAFSLSFMEQITAIKPKNKKKRHKQSDSSESSNQSVRTTRLPSNLSKNSNQNSSAGSSFSSNKSFQSLNSNVKTPIKDRKKQEPVNQQDQSLYEIDLQAVARLQDSRTSVMIRNIPNKYNQSIILQEINERMQKYHLQSCYDFFYLPIDFKNKQCNMGYAFINFVDACFIPLFYEEFVGKK